MKWQSISIVLVISFILLSKIPNAQEYHPFPEENAFWTVDEFVGINWREVYVYTIKGDTIINDLNYKKIYKLNDIPKRPDTLWILHSFMRQDVENKKVFFIRHYLGENTEKLGYDFNVTIGDTVMLPAFDYQNSGDSIFKVAEPTFDSIQLHNGEYRNIYFFIPIPLLPGSLSLYVVEGVGEQRTPFPNLLFYDPFHQSELYCHTVNGVYLYGSSPYPDACDFTVNIEEIQVKSQLKCNPNPANNEVIVTFPEPLTGNSELNIMNLLGVIVLKQKILPNEKELHIDASRLRSGIYFISVKNNAIQQFYKMKIILNP